MSFWNLALFLVFENPFSLITLISNNTCRNLLSQTFNISTLFPLCNFVTKLWCHIFDYSCCTCPTEKMFGKTSKKLTGKRPSKKTFWCACSPVSLKRTLYRVFSGKTVGGFRKTRLQNMIERPHIKNDHPKNSKLMDVFGFYSIAHTTFF